MYHVFSRTKKPNCKNQLDIQLRFTQKGNPYDFEGEKGTEEHLSHRYNSHLPSRELPQKREDNLKSEM